MKTIAVFPNTEKIESAGVLERIKDFFADKDVRLVMLREPAEKFGYPELAVKNKDIHNADIGLSIRGDGTL